MSTSGTVGAVSVEAVTFIDHACLACGKPPSTLSGEMLFRAKERLQYLLWSLANDGVNLWAIKKTVFNLLQNKSVIPMASGTVDVINTLFRMLTPMSALSILNGAGYQGVILQSPLVIQNVSGVFSASGNATLKVQYSPDLGITWVDVVSLNTVAVAALSSFSIDIDNSANSAYWRVLDTSGALIPLTALLFRTIQNELPASKLNRDDYQQLPNKGQAGSQVLQYWYDKQINPQLWIWLTPNVDNTQLVVWEHSLIQDVGTYVNNVAVPMRWYEAIISLLAYRLALMLPPAELPDGRLALLKQQAQEDKARASNGESDGSSSRMAPNIGAYTR